MSPATDKAPNGVVGVQTLISTAVVLFMAFGGGWTLFQSQFTALQKQIDATQIYAERTSSTQQGEIAAVEQTLRNDIQAVLIPRKEFDEFKARYETLKAEVDRLQQEAHVAALASARHPVEKDTLEAIDADFNKRIDIIQTEIQDINRQIAAALIIIDNNSLSGVRRLPPDDPAMKK